eukprot:s650_g13.t1
MQEQSGMKRFRCTALKDGASGWATVVNSQGTVYLEVATIACMPIFRHTHLSHHVFHVVSEPFQREMIALSRACRRLHPHQGFETSHRCPIVGGWSFYHSGACQSLMTTSGIAEGKAVRQGAAIAAAKIAGRYPGKANAEATARLLGQLLDDKDPLVRREAARGILEYLPGVQKDQQTTAGLPAFEASVNLDATDPQRLFFLATLLYHAGRHQQAEAFYYQVGALLRVRHGEVK